jgi:hypothetical protein
MDFPMDCKGLRIGASVWQCFIKPLSPKKAENHHCLWSITKTELLLWQFTNGCTKLGCCKPSLKLSSFANHHWSSQALQTITETLKLYKPSLKLSSWSSQALQTITAPLKLCKPCLKLLSFELDRTSRFGDATIWEYKCQNRENLERQKTTKFSNPPPPKQHFAYHGIQGSSDTQAENCSQRFFLAPVILSSPLSAKHEDWFLLALQISNPVAIYC